METVPEIGAQLAGCGRLADIVEHEIDKRIEAKIREQQEAIKMFELSKIRGYAKSAELCRGGLAALRHLKRTMPAKWQRIYCLEPVIK